MFKYLIIPENRIPSWHRKNLEKEKGNEHRFKRKTNNATRLTATASKELVLYLLKLKEKIREKNNE